MGANMARRLKDVGYAVTAVYDVDRERARDLAGEIGAMAVERLAALTAASDVIVTVVTDDDAMRVIFTGEGDSLLVDAAGKSSSTRGRSRRTCTSRSRRAWRMPADGRSRRAWRVRSRKRATANST
jgi:hypothetical protein